ncbi:MAG: GNAT family protein, partial [Propionicimonas sp.]
DHLGFEQLTSGAFADNPASNGVSRRVGYQPNGVDRLARRGTWVANNKYLLTPATFIRGTPVSVTGADAVRQFVGLDA